MQVVMEEARSSYPAEIVVDLESETSDHLEANVERIIGWITQWLENSKEVN